MRGGVTMDRVLLIKYGELTTKKANRNFFINTLYRNVCEKLKGYEVKIYKDRARMLIEFLEKDLDSIQDIINHIFGIHTYHIAYVVDSNDSVIQSRLLEIMKEVSFHTFKVEVKRCEFIALLKDHSKSKAKVDPNYPQLPTYIYRFDVTETGLAEIEKFIFDKVAELEKAELLADEELPPCTKEERWATEDKWAIMKAGRKTALKVCSSEEEAKSLMETMGGTDIEFRQGESKKCVDGYCVCRNYCPFYKKLVDNK